MHLHPNPFQCLPQEIEDIIWEYADNKKEKFQLVIDQFLYNYQWRCEEIEIAFMDQYVDFTFSCTPSGINVDMKNPVYYNGQHQFQLICIIEERTIDDYMPPLIDIENYLEEDHNLLNRQQTPWNGTYYETLTGINYGVETQIINFDNINAETGSLQEETQGL